ncbi:hypothetical protein [Leucobacter massiliensis]|uniref:Uncharacterized protein n=1 Tax=Leucobacter massiliensis TaxID=1686285 RepID=A0A2S9QKE6_9MICO|nr:hypothetical protein [Leucobacter massiliensis]PRI10032.1 hypothetical protein B4915_14005 [Leucobacter massiliensis]PRI10055.1 hypothetical protein B4915_14150 [Leucobacter massiliensis]
MPSTPPMPPAPVRMIVTWIGIFPLVLLAQWLLRPLTAAWPLVLSTGLTLAVVVPLAVGVVIPTLFRVLGMLRRRRAETTAA